MSLAKAARTSGYIIDPQDGGTESDQLRNKPAAVPVNLHGDTPLGLPKRSKPQKRASLAKEAAGVAHGFSSTAVRGLGGPYMVHSPEDGQRLLSRVRRWRAQGTKDSVKQLRFRLTKKATLALNLDNPKDKARYDRHQKKMYRRSSVLQKKYGLNKADAEHHTLQEQSWGPGYEERFLAKKATSTTSEYGYGSLSSSQFESRRNGENKPTNKTPDQERAEMALYEGLMGQKHPKRLKAEKKLKKLQRDSSSTSANFSRAIDGENLIGNPGGQAGMA